MKFTIEITRGNSPRQLFQRIRQRHRSAVDAIREPRDCCKHCGPQTRKTRPRGTVCSIPATSSSTVDGEVPAVCNAELSGY